MCGECWLQVVDDKAFCQDCVALIRQPVSALLPIGAATLAVGALALTARALPFDPYIAWGAAAAGAAMAIVAAWRITRRANARRAARTVGARPPLPPAPEVRGHPFRGAARRIGRRVAPPVSAGMAVFVIGAALVLTGALLPGALDLPRWLEIEVVLLAWWLLMTVTLTVLLYRGWRIARDHD